MLGKERPRWSKGFISQKPEEARADPPGSRKEEVSEGGGRGQGRRRWGKEKEAGSVKEEEVGEGDGQGRGRRRSTKDIQLRFARPPPTAPLRSAAITGSRRGEIRRRLGERKHTGSDCIPSEVRSRRRQRRRRVGERVEEAGSGEEEQVGKGGGEVGEGGAGEEVGEIRRSLPAQWIWPDPVGGEVGEEEEEGGRERGGGRVGGGGGVGRRRWGQGRRRRSGKE